MIRSTEGAAQRQMNRESSIAGGYECDVAGLVVAQLPFAIYRPPISHAALTGLASFLGHTQGVVATLLALG
jgi:hypothetical protein